MRLVIQRVSSARVSVGKKVLGAIDKGLFVLVGVSEVDKKEDAGKLAEKLANLRVMADERAKMNLSVKVVGASVLAVSQFTLYADTTAGNRPSFIKAAKPNLAEKIYERFIDELKDQGVKVETGQFGEYMEIDTVLDGPVTIIMDS
jgi:D-tyrosyl-tRNA(Tyr) deacylase